MPNGQVYMDFYERQHFDTETCNIWSPLDFDEPKQQKLLYKGYLSFGFKNIAILFNDFVGMTYIEGNLDFNLVGFKAEIREDNTKKGFDSNASHYNLRFYRRFDEYDIQCLENKALWAKFYLQVYEQGLVAIITKDKDNNKGLYATPEDNNRDQYFVFGVRGQRKPKLTEGVFVGSIDYGYLLIQLKDGYAYIRMMFKNEDKKGKVIHFVSHKAHDIIIWKESFTGKKKKLLTQVTMRNAWPGEDLSKARNYLNDQKGTSNTKLPKL